jgi:hypothetical protein
MKATARRQKTKKKTNPRTVAANLNIPSTSKQIRHALS